jgi:glucose-6-phosphate isomerase
MKFDFSQIGVPEEELFGTGKDLEKAIQGFSQKGQGFLDVLDDSVKEILLFAEQKREKYEKIVVLGVGGSALGSRMLANYFDNEKLIVLDTLDPHAVEKVLKSVPIPRTLWIVASKSGSTFETIFLRDMLVVGIPSSNWAVVTEKESPLWKWAQNIDCPAFDMPKNVGGRFSVLTAVGLLPAALAGLPIEKLLSGAKKMREIVLCNDVAKNGAWQMARAIEIFGRNNIVHWAYCSALETFGAWWKQLVAESLGKNGRGITPISALGPTDQHSLLQLVTEGEDNFFHVFIKDASIERSPLGKIMNTELRATTQSLTELGRPSCILDISNRNAETLGQLIVFWEMTVVFLGELRGINAFDQPGVERGKVLTKEMLEAKK